MQWVLLAAGLLLTGGAARRCRQLRMQGCKEAAWRLYRRSSWALGTAVLLSMAAQEAALWASGLLSWRTGLPLHLCSLTGLLTLPMLLGRNRSLKALALYAGVPGALLALMFPAVMTTRFAVLTRVAFHALHAGLVCAPLLPLGMGFRPWPRDALRALGLLLLAGAAAMAANALTGGNYLFLADPVAGTPLLLLAKGGIWAYRGRLLALAAALMAAEAGAVAWWRERSFHKFHGDEM